MAMNVKMWYNIYRKKFLQRMIRPGFLQCNNASIEEARNILTHNVEAPTAKSIDKSGIFHDETIFHNNEDQSRQWSVTGTCAVKLKSKGNVSRFWTSLGRRGFVLRLK